ncbi:hypothetical protein WG909_05795 [Peptostreptococcaceae bacterium AGR-M142]
MLKNISFNEIGTTLFAFVLVYNGIRKDKRDAFTFLFMVAAIIWLIYMLWKILSGYII